MKLMVTGGNGFIGSTLLRTVLERGLYQEVFAVVRPGSENAHLPQDPRLKLVSYEGTAESLREAAEASAGVIHLGALYTAARTDEAVDKLLEANISFSSHLLQAVSDSTTPTPVISASTFSAYDETYSYAPKNFYSATKAAVEALAAAFPIPTTFLRFPDTYGPGDWRKKVHNLLKWAVEAEETSFTFQKPAHQVVNLAHVEDVVDALLHAVTLAPLSAGVKVYDLFREENNITLEEVADSLIRGSKTSASFPLVGEVEALPPERYPLPSFTMAHNPHRDLAHTLFERPGK